MSLLDAIDESTSKVAGSGEDYIRTTKEYYELKVFQQLTLIFSYFLKVVIFGSLFALGFIFIAISGAKALNEALESSILGYFMVGALFFVLSGIVYLGRHLIDGKIIQKMAKNFFDR